MKKFFTIIFFLLFYLLRINAQNGASVRFGIIAGLNYAHFLGTDTERFYPRSGFQIGGYSQHILSENFLIQPEMILTLKGASEDVTIGKNDLTFTFKFIYVELPILFKYMLITDRSIPLRPHLFAGPAFAFKIYSALEGDLNGNTASEPLSNFKSFDFGIVFGGGITIPSGGSDVLVFLKYTLGLMQIDRSTQNRRDFRNSVITLGFGITI